MQGHRAKFVAADDTLALQVGLIGALCNGIKYRPAADCTDQPAGVIDDRRQWRVARLKKILELIKSGGGIDRIDRGGELLQD